MFRYGDKNQETGRNQFKIDNTSGRRNMSNVSMDSKGSKNFSKNSNNKSKRLGVGDENEINLPGMVLDSDEGEVTRGVGAEPSSVAGSEEKSINTGGLGGVGGNVNTSHLSVQQPQRLQPRQRTKDSKIRRGPVLLKKTLSSLSLSSAASEDEGMSSTQDQLHSSSNQEPAQQQQQLQGPHRKHAGSVGSGSSSVSAQQRQQEQLEQSQQNQQTQSSAPVPAVSAASAKRFSHGNRHGAQNDSSSGSSSRKQSLAGSFFKKLSGAGNSDSEFGNKDKDASSHNYRQSLSRGGGNHHHGGLHSSFYNNMASMTGSRRSSKENYPAIGGNASSGSNGNNPGAHGNIIESVPSSLRRKVSTLVHGFGHDSEQSSSHSGRRVFNHDKSNRHDSDNISVNSGSKPRLSAGGSRRNSATSLFTNTSMTPAHSTSPMRRRDSPPKHSLGQANNSAPLEASANSSKIDNGGERGIFFPLDTNLENVSDITKAPELSKRPSVIHEGRNNSSDNKASISRIPSQSVTHVNSNTDIPALPNPKGQTSISPNANQRWVAPESWDVDSSFDVRRSKRHNKSLLHQDQSALQKHSRQQKSGEFVDASSEVPENQNELASGISSANASDDSSLADLSNSSSSDLDYASDVENYLEQGTDQKTGTIEGSPQLPEDFQRQFSQQRNQTSPPLLKLNKNSDQNLVNQGQRQSMQEALEQSPQDMRYYEGLHQKKRREEAEVIESNRRLLSEQQLKQQNQQHEQQQHGQQQYQQKDSQALGQSPQLQQYQKQLQQQHEQPASKDYLGKPRVELGEVSSPSKSLAKVLGAGTGDQEIMRLSSDDEKHDRVEYELERYYKDFSDLDPKRHYAIRIFNTDNTFTTLSCTPATTVRDILPSLKRKFNVTSQGSFQISLKVGKLSKILRPLSKPIIIERKLLLLNGYKKTDPLHIMGIEDLSFVFKFLFHPVAPSHLTSEQEQRLMRSDFVHVDLRGMDLTTPPIIFYQHTSEVESLDVSNNANIFLPLEFVESATKLSSLRMVNIRASKFPINVCDVDELVSLELQRNFIRKVPHSISQLTNLTILNLQCNELDKLPRGFSQLKNLQLLDLSSNRFVHYPEVVNECLNLLQVNLSYNKIHTLPPTTNHLVKLAKMNLSHNKLGDIPELTEMKNLRTLNLQHNRVARIKTGAPNLQNLSLTDNRISTFDDILPKLKTLELQENPITSISYNGVFPMNMTSLSLSKAKLSSIPGELFVELRCLEKLDLSENNLTKLPDEFCLLNKLVHVSVARNKLQKLPIDFNNLKNLKTLDLHSNNIRDFAGGMEDLDITYVNISSNMFGNSCLMGQFCQNISSDSRLSKSLEFLVAADNQFNDQMWPLFNCLTQLKVLNLSYNDFQDISNLKLENLVGLYFSGNKLATVSGDVVLKWKNLKTLMLNGNYLLSLPAELSQLTNLNVFDVGSNQLKYNISNYNYDWNWRKNKQLKYLNFSGNRRFEIKSSVSHDIKTDLSDLTVLPRLKVLGLMDVTLNTAKVPDENINFRLRTNGSMINGMRYGVADTLGKRNFVSSRDVTFERFAGKDDECLLCLHDGKNQYADYGHNIARLVRDIYDKILLRQLEKYGDSDVCIRKAMRFSFLQLNKEINGMLSHVDNGSSMANLSSADLLSGACSTVVYIKGNKVYTANIGDCMAILSKTNGDFQMLTSLHVPFKREEYERIRISGGYVNDDKLDGVVDVSRAVGFFDLLPHIHASPDISVVQLTKADEMLIIATHKLWEYMDFETACDIARENSSEPMLAAEAMKDHVIAYGCTDNLTIMCLALHKDNEQQNRFTLNKNSLITRRSTFEDATLRRLQPEIAPPTGNLAIVFTDIKNSTFLWEMFPNAMRTAIKTHNDIMRRLLRIYGGYEVKTEGDAFMVAFPTPISSLVWCMSVQLKFLEAQWPEEITSIQDGCLVIDRQGNKIYQGLSVRMGVHWGCPVPELDLVTQRMDYLGPMVNKAARVEGVADGGQITLSSDFLSEFNKIMKFHETVVQDKRPLKEVYGEKFIGEVLEKEISMLESIGWIFFDHGEQKLKGLETKELITIAYPKSLVSRHNFITKDEEARLLNEEFMCRLRSVSRRVESVLSAVSNGSVDEYRKPGRLSSIDESVKNSVKFLNSETDATAFFDDLVTRLESSIALLKLHQTMHKGLKFDAQRNAQSLGTGIFDILDAVLGELQQSSDNS